MNYWSIGLAQWKVGILYWCIIKWYKHAEGCHSANKERERHIVQHVCYICDILYLLWCSLGFFWLQFGEELANQFRSGRRRKGLQSADIFNFSVTWTLVFCMHCKFTELNVFSSQENIEVFDLGNYEAWPRALAEIRDTIALRLYRCYLPIIPLVLVASHISVASAQGSIDTGQNSCQCSLILFSVEFALLFANYFSPGGHIYYGPVCLHRASHRHSSALEIAHPAAGLSLWCQELLHWWLTTKMVLDHITPTPCDT